MAVPDAAADLYLVGLGIGGFDRRSVETDEILRTAKKIFHLTAYHQELLSLSNGEVISLEQEYAQEGSPRSAYRGMADLVLKETAALRGKDHACFLTYGHPLFLVDSGWMLLEMGASSGISVKAVPATSFLDAVLPDMGARFDCAVQLYEANLFVQYRIEPDTRIPLMLSQFGSFGIERLRQRDNLYGRTEPLTARLREIYPPDRDVSLVLSAWRSDMAPQIVHATIAEIDTLVTRSHSGTSLYISGSEPWTRPGEGWTRTTYRSE
ncbi:SAM-dependent methyltransferase [Streptomyces sp. NPDC001212]